MFLPACIYVHHLCAGAFRCQKRASGALELELEGDSYKLSHGCWESNPTSILWKNTQSSYLVSQLSGPGYSF